MAYENRAHRDSPPGAGKARAQSSQPPARLADRDDDVLMELVARDQAPAFESLVERYETKVLSFAVKYLGEVAHAEEATQDTFMRLWKLRHAYQARGRFRAFLLGLSLNACRELRRSRRRRLAAHDRYAGEPQSISVFGPQQAGAEARRRNATIARAVASLPVRFREAVLLRFYQDLSYFEIAQILGVSESTLRSRVFHGLKRLRPLLREEAP